MAPSPDDTQQPGIWPPDLDLGKAEEEFEDIAHLRHEAEKWFDANGFDSGDLVSTYAWCYGKDRPPKTIGFRSVSKEVAAKLRASPPTRRKA